MATATNSTVRSKIDLAAVMRDAWRRYRICFRNRLFCRKNFAFSLGCAWDAAKAAFVTPTEQRVAEIKLRIDMLPYKPLKVDIISVERKLRAELEAVA